MPLHPDVVRMLEQTPPFDTGLSPDEVRANGAARRPPPTGDPSVQAEDLSLPGPAGPIPARRYTPAGGNTGRGLLVYFHGGGFVLGDLESHDGVCRDLAAGSGAGVLAVDYRLAPEHRFPAAVDDAWAAVRFAHEHAGELGADGANLAVGGDSAGGNLAAVMALMARDAGIPLRLQLLAYPVIDWHDQRAARASSVENGDGYFLTSAAMDWFDGHYAPDPADWRASPLLAPDLGGVAPACVLTCEYDPLRDEGDAYAKALEAAGVAVEHRCYPGLIHGVLAMGAVVPAARGFMDDCCRALGEALGHGGRR